jgi:predicted phosphodiesterase
MKILALSDEVVEALYSAAITDRYADVDVVIGCGDLPFYYLEFIVTMLNVPLYYVPGNHDKPNQYLSDGRILSRAEGCELIDGRTAVCARVGRPPLLLAGLGGSLRYNDAAEHQYTQSEMAARAWGLGPALLANRLRFGRALDVLVAHAPPRGIHDAADQAHTGFDAYRRFMDMFQPRFLLHGHSHVYRPDTVTRTAYQRTEVLNVYPYRLIEWEPGRHG